MRELSIFFFSQRRPSSVFRRPSLIVAHPRSSCFWSAHAPCLAGFKRAALSPCSVRVSTRHIHRRAYQVLSSSDERLRCLLHLTELRSLQCAISGAPHIFVYKAIDEVSSEGICPVLSLAGKKMPSFTKAKRQEWRRSTRKQSQSARST